MTLIKLLPAVSQISAIAGIKMFCVIADILTYIASKELFKNNGFPMRMIAKQNFEEFFNSLFMLMKLSPRKYLGDAGQKLNFASSSKWLAIVGAIGIIYYGASKLGMVVALQIPPGNISAVWFPSRSLGLPCFGEAITFGQEFLSLILSLEFPTT